MVCIFCQTKLDVINSRPNKRSNQIWRRRQCPNCHAVFTSSEIIDLSKSIRYETAEKRLEPFWRPILLISIYEACKHRKAPQNDANALTDTIIARLLRKKSAVITRNELCKVTTEVLSRFDKAAAVQYKAFHPIKSEAKL